jgi:hypothetical protein
MTRKPLTALAIALLLLLVATTASADDPTKQREFVYGLNLFNGVDFSTGFIPRYVDTLYVLANATSTLDPKQTDVYYWPLTHEYRGDFGSVDQIVTGTLEISQGGKVISTQPLTDYVIQFDQAGGLGNGRLYVGEEAHQRQATFVQERQDYLKRLQDYTDASNAYTAQIDALSKQANAGQNVKVPDPPNQPAPFTLFSTDVVRGFPIKLAPGEYDLRVRDPSGAIVPDSEKRVIAISPRRDGIGYQVVPQEQVTAPSPADDPSDAIYTVPGGTVYLEPFSTKEFNALQYARLENPQDLQATANNWTWVHVAALTGVSLRVEHDGQTDTIPLSEFTNQMTPGTALGYTIVPFARDPSAPPPGSLGAPTPDLVAFMVVAPNRRTSLTVSMVDQDGKPIAGSARQIFVNPPLVLWQLALPVMFPLLVGLTVILWRRERLVTRRSLPPEKRLQIA